MRRREKKNRKKCGEKMEMQLFEQVQQTASPLLYFLLGMAFVIALIALWIQVTAASKKNSNKPKKASAKTRKKSPPKITEGDIKAIEVIAALAEIYREVNSHR